MIAKRLMLLPLFALAMPAMAQEAPNDGLYKMPDGVVSRWTSPENLSGKAGAGGKANKGAKGSAFIAVPAHHSVDLLNISGPGIVRRLKMTVKNRSPEQLRSVRIAMYWDGATKPAVSVPLGDFFGTAFGQTARYETSLFKDTEGRSFEFTIPMPFRKGARIAIVNDGDVDVTHLFYNVNFEKWDHPPAKNMLYFHAYWHRDQPPVGKDFVVLPDVVGNGRFLGASIGVKASSAYGIHRVGEDPQNLWWGEGEVKMWIDGDGQYPSLVGTGVEDYFGSAWGMKQFVTLNSGCVIADPTTLHWSCYRYHVPDPVWFHKGIRVQIQQIGGGPIEQVRQIQRQGAPMIPISVDGDHGKFWPLLSMKDAPKLADKDFPTGWVNYYRSDDWSATAYFYLDRPTDNLPPIQSVKERTRDL